MLANDPDLPLRRAAVTRARELTALHDDLVPRDRIWEGFFVGRQRVSFGSLMSGIYRAREQQGPAALTLTTSFRDPYADKVASDGSFSYAYRSGKSGKIDQPDNRARRAAHELRTPLVYFRAVNPGQYVVVAPAFVTADDPSTRSVRVQQGLPMVDMRSGGLTSSRDVRAYATREARFRVHQQRFKLAVMRAYSHRCAVCALAEPALLQAAHIISDTDPDGIAAVENGLALCAIHHLAYDRELLGIDSAGVVHIAQRLLRDAAPPILRTGFADFHGRPIAVPRRRVQRPDPERLHRRFEQFELRMAS
jgi:putative restriction endonuclease